MIQKFKTHDQPLRFCVVRWDNRKLHDNIDFAKTKYGYKWWVRVQSKLPCLECRKPARDIARNRYDFFFFGPALHGRTSPDTLNLFLKDLKTNGYFFITPRIS